MLHKLIIALITLFWAVMSVLLWRAEYGPRKAVGSAVPASLVWEKVLTAPDPSNLEIHYGTNRIGYCRWRPDVGQEFATGARLNDPNQFVEGMVHRLSYYTLDVDGNVLWPDLPQRVRFGFALRLETNQTWQTFSLRVRVRPDTYEIRGDASEQALHVRVEAGDDSLVRTIPFSDLQNPQKLLAELGGPALPLMLGIAGFSAPSNQLAQTVRLQWQAHNDSLRLGRNVVRAYRLHARLLGRYEAVFYVSPVGEILRAELPPGIVLVNDRVSTLQPLE